MLHYAGHEVYIHFDYIQKQPENVTVIIQTHNSDSYQFHMQLMLVGAPKLYSVTS